MESPPEGLPFGCIFANDNVASMEDLAVVKTRPRRLLAATVTPTISPDRFIAGPPLKPPNVVVFGFRVRSTQATTGSTCL